MIGFYAALADRWYSYRWWFAAATGAMFVMLLVSIPLAAMTSPSFLVVGALAGPFVAVSWGLLCMCVWFHPVRGNLMTGWLVTRMPSGLAYLLRLYFAVFLTAWFAFGVIAWPLFVLRGVSA